MWTWDEYFDGLVWHVHGQLELRHPILSRGGNLLFRSRWYHARGSSPDQDRAWDQAEDAVEASLQAHILGLAHGPEQVHAADLEAWGYVRDGEGWKMRKSPVS